MADSPEKKIENKIKQNLNQLGAYWFKTWGGTYSKKGIPDIIGCYRQHFIAIEVKRPQGGKPTPVQIRHLYQIAQNGGIALLSNDPNCTLTSEYLKQIHQIPLTLSQVQQLDAQQAKQLWQQFDGPHTIQISVIDS